MHTNYSATIIPQFCPFFQIKSIILNEYGENQIEMLLKQQSNMIMRQLDRKRKLQITERHKFSTPYCAHFRKQIDIYISVQSSTATLAQRHNQNRRQLTRNKTFDFPSFFSTQIRNFL